MSEKFNVNFMNFLERKDPQGFKLIAKLKGDWNDANYVTEEVELYSYPNNCFLCSEEKVYCYLILKVLYDKDIFTSLENWPNENCNGELCEALRDTELGEYFKEELPFLGNSDAGINAHTINEFKILDNHGNEYEIKGVNFNKLKENIIKYSKVFYWDNDEDICKKVFLESII